jgi:hypothetical protein
VREREREREKEREREGEERERERERETGGQGFSLAKQELYCLSHASSPFCPGYFSVLQISASQVTRIIGMSHRHLTD